MRVPNMTKERRATHPSPPCSHAWLNWAVPLLTAGTSLAVYLLTLTPEIDWGDSAELCLQAHQLGVTHPPGYPVHTFLGKFFGLFISDPAIATNALSAVSTAAAVGLLSALALHLTGSAWAAVCGGLIFAFVPKVWQLAVTTEVYNVSVCFVALSLLLLVRWFAGPKRQVPYPAAVVTGISLGASLANALLLPGLIYPVWARRRSALWRPATFVAIVILVGGMTLSWTYFRSKTSLPLGASYVPDSLGNFWRYLSGHQYRATPTVPAEFYVRRALEHARFFAGSFLWVGVLLAAAGLRLLWKKNRTLWIALGLMFVLNMGYFTAYAWTAYRTMVMPSYFVFSLWIAFGIAWALTIRNGLARTAVAVLIPTALACGLLLTQMSAKLHRSRVTPVTSSALASLASFPHQATVLAKWDTFTVLLYFQQTRGLRPDLRLLERSTQWRRYAWGTADEWLSYIAATLGARPVIVDAVDVSLVRQYQCRALNMRWIEVRPRPAAPSAESPTSYEDIPRR